MKDNVLILPAKPGLSLFCCKTDTREVAMIGKIYFTLQEIREGVRKSYQVVKLPNVLYLQDITEKRAKKKFNKFILYKLKQQKDEKIKSS